MRRDRRAGAGSRLVLSFALAPALVSPLLGQQDERWESYRVQVAPVNWRLENQWRKEGNGLLAKLQYTFRR